MAVHFFKFNPLILSHGYYVQGKFIIIAAQKIFLSFYYVKNGIKTEFLHKFVHIFFDFDL